MYEYRDIERSDDLQSTRGKGFPIGHSGDKLRRAIEESGKTVTQVAAESGVTRSTVNRMMSTGAGMLYSWNAVAKAIGVDVSELVRGNDG